MAFKAEVFDPGHRHHGGKAMSTVCFLNYVVVVAIYLRAQHHNKNNIPLPAEPQTSCSVLKRGKLIFL